MGKISGKFFIIVSLAFTALVSCAGSLGSKVPLGGISKLIETPSLIGMTKEQILKSAGPPVHTTACQVNVSIADGGEELIGEAFGWVFEYEDEVTGDSQKYALYSCLVDDIAVAEDRKWDIKDSGRQMEGETKVIDKKLVKDILKSRDPSKFKPHYYKGPELSI